MPLAFSPELIPGADDLVGQLEALCARQFEGASGPGRLGDILLDAAAVEFDGKQVAQHLEAWSLDPLERELLLELCSRSRLFSKRWKPKRSRPDDGIFEGAVLDRSGWSDWKGSDDIFQAAVILFGDMLAVKTAEHRFDLYQKHVGAKYLSIGAVPDSMERGTLANAQPFAALRFAFEADLPFPFGGYACVAQLFHRIDEKGRVVTDLWSTSADFLWLASQDVYLPVETNAGERIAYLLVRRHGFDLAGIPDGAKDRRSALRESMGNLARDLSPTGQISPAFTDDPGEALARFPVRGWTQAD